MSRILIIDDSSFQRKSIRAIIKSGGHETVEAKNGVEGLEIMLNDNFDCVFCDLLMPELDGFGVLEGAKSQGDDTPIIILTADKQDTSRNKALDLGAVQVLNKPPKVEEVHLLISTLKEKNAS